MKSRRYCRIFFAAKSLCTAKWMIRAFAIGLAVATIRPIIGFFATSRFTGLTPNEYFGTAFWIGFVLHLIAAEAWIHWTRSQTAGMRVEVRVNS